MLISASDWPPSHKKLTPCRGDRRRRCFSSAFRSVYFSRRLHSAYALVAHTQLTPTSVVY